VSAELGWGGSDYGILRARATQVGPWEWFTLCWWSSSDPTKTIYAIQSDANGKFVSNELGWSGNRYGILRARATDIGPWEHFHIGVTCPGSICWWFESATIGRYVSAEFGWAGNDKGILRSRATAIGPWEQFSPVPPGCNPCLGPAREVSRTAGTPRRS
jgi:hypothetical protein